eukprot:CAMPEP_0178895552 /NCGR_PEP_ID=MMETSP0786-20121207/656_1 /TAXON_ID=186022 /ORGANISM="Thalassionema frauenfeldii, Strain CCMP 1798" /LENGTH=796 /DNA_ID=CAMNT_0020565807 /DNA_START=43 /DNA_END=2429 /DNA_ORIENTATION=+
MVVPCAIAAVKTAGCAAEAGATAFGLGMGQKEMELSRNLFKMQMQQAKRLWTADWAEASLRHGEQCMQSAQQHAESQAMATAAYFQAEKIASQSFKLARDQDSRAYEMSWRAEVREALRDDLQNQNNRFNSIMLCDTVCLGCIFGFVSDGFPPDETAPIMLMTYVFFLGLSITLFSISMWCALIVVRRLHEHTAAILERKLFAQSEDLQKEWERQLNNNLPTGPSEVYLVNQAYERWLDNYLTPAGECSIQLLSFGVVAMFITAGLLTHNVYLLQYQSISAIIIFWSFVFITSATVLYMKFSEDILEKRKEGVYDSSWFDNSSVETGPFAKIYKAAEELFSNSAVDLASTERMEAFSDREEMERELCSKSKILQQRVESLRKESDNRAATREEVLKILTTAAEELDALPEDLTSSLNKMIYAVDEADKRTTALVTKSPQKVLVKSPSNRWRSQHCLALNPKKQMNPDPIDAKRIPVSLGPLRKKLGEYHLSTLLRIKNTSDEPLRLKSGVQLKEGKYVASLNSTTAKGSAVVHQLYPGTEIPPRTEILIASRGKGRLVPTSGIDGTVVYTNRDESWVFRISFRNELLNVRNGRRCEVKAIPCGKDFQVKAEQHWKISKDEFDRKANNEVAVSIDLLEGAEAAKADYTRRQSKISLKAGFLLKAKYGLGIHWNQRWCELTPVELVFQDMETEKTETIAIKDIKVARKSPDMMKKNIFDIETFIKGERPYKLAAASPSDRDDWIRKISNASESIRVHNLESLVDKDDLESFLSEDSSSGRSPIESAIECVTGEKGVEV